MIFHKISSLIFLVISLIPILTVASKYRISRAQGLGRRFDGIGAISGGGCSTRLFADYNTTSYNQIMDYLFLPGFGASLQILKVEIGGDVQSTDGTEPSHMHSADDEIMHEVMNGKLCWGFPGWVGEGKRSPWTNSTVNYTLKWILGAKKYYNLDIDYIGIWNERSWNRGYTLSLKAAINTAGLKTKIVGHDASWDVCDDLSNDPEWAASIDIIGAHYPGSKIKTNCAILNKTQWASEDLGVDWNYGAECWSRELNQNYIRANLTATIAWDLVDSFYDGLKFAGDGIIRAVEPWSGFYEVGRVLWAAAHWGQFTRVGWYFLQHDQGVGLLDNGGSYVTLTDPNNKQLTIIIETMKYNNSQCSWSQSVYYNTTEQTATFELDNSFAHITELFIFVSNFNTIDVNQSFIYKGIVKLTNGSFTLDLPVGMLYTLSTINGTKNIYEVPSPMAFPMIYHDDFNRYEISSEAAYFSDQSGSWEIVETSTSHGKVMRQMVTELPISWCGEAPYPYSVIGDSKWGVPFNASVDVLIEDIGTAFIAIEVSRGSCEASGVGSSGVVFSISTINNGSWQLTASTNISNPLSYGNILIKAGTWYTIGLATLFDHSEAFINGYRIGQCNLTSTSFTGFIAIGSSWNHVQFDNFQFREVV